VDVELERSGPAYERLFDLAVVLGVPVSDFLAVDQDALYDEIES
jgi:hypothetical protein